MGSNKTRENLLRRTAERRGYVLRKSRRRDPHAVDFGVYSILDGVRNVVLSEAGDLDDVENWLKADAEAA